MDNKFKYVGLAIGGFIIFAAISFFIFKEGNVIIEADTASQKIYSGEDVLDREEKIFVYIVGAVQKPGIIDIPIDSRLFEVIELAGGATSEADLDKINLAEVVSDEQKIVIPYKISGDLKEDINQKYYEDSNSNLININTANKTELETLSGVGSTTAMNIINYREKNGKFKRIDDLKNVSGIGESKFETIKANITI